MAGRPLRSVIREQEFDEQLERLIVNLEEADDFTFAAEVILAADPLAGVPTADPQIRALTMAPVRGLTPILYYTFDDRFVVFLSIIAF